MKRLGITLAFVFACALAAAPALNALAESQQKPTKASLREDMRKLWTDHVVWTRDYIIAAAADAPDAQAAAGRLLKNQEDIGAAVGGFYGKAAGDQLTTLL